MDGSLELGRVIASARVFKYMSENEYFNTFVGFCITLYISGNWGVVEHIGDHVIASYPVPMDLRDQVDGEERLWIMTDWDRSETTLMFPDEY